MVIEGNSQEISEGASDSEFVFEVYDDPVMRTAIDVLEKLGKKSKVILRAKGRSIPNAVAIANIITEKMMKNNSFIQDIKVDSETKNEMGRMLSFIEIILVKKI